MHFVFVKSIWQWLDKHSIRRRQSILLVLMVPKILRKVNMLSIWDFSFSLATRKRYSFKPFSADRVKGKCPYGPDVDSSPYSGDWKADLAPNLNSLFAMKNGVLELYDSEADKEACRASQNYFYPDTDEFVEDQAIVMAMMASGQCKTFCYQRLQYLDAKWRLHDLLNGSKVSQMYFTSKFDRLL